MIRQIENEAFYDKALQNKIENFNMEASGLQSDRTAIEAELATIKAQALSGEVDQLAGLAKKRDTLKAKLLTNLIDSAKLEGTRNSFRVPIEEAYKAERVKRQDTLDARLREINEVFETHGFGTRYIQGVINQTTPQLRYNVQEVIYPPKMETDIDVANVMEMRKKIAELMA